MTAAAEPRPETDAPVSPEPDQAENTAADAAVEAAAETAPEAPETSDASAPDEASAEASAPAETPAPTAGDDEPWGRVDEDGTVSVREAAGWRVVGQYPDGTAEEALAYYERK